MPAGLKYPAAVVLQSFQNPTVVVVSVIVVVVVVTVVVEVVLVLVLVLMLVPELALDADVEDEKEAWGDGVGGGLSPNAAASSAPARLLLLLLLLLLLALLPVWLPSSSSCETESRPPAPNAPAMITPIRTNITAAPITIFLSGKPLPFFFEYAFKLFGLWLLPSVSATHGTVVFDCNPSEPNVVVAIEPIRAVPGGGFPTTAFAAPAAAASNVSTLATRLSREMPMSEDPLLGSAAASNVLTLGTRLSREMPMSEEPLLGSVLLGMLARSQRSPTNRVLSCKSWLCTGASIYIYKKVN